MFVVLDQDMTMPITAKIADVRKEFERLSTSKTWLKNECKLKNGRERVTFTIEGETLMHTFDIDKANKRVYHVFQAGRMFTSECARFQPKKAK